MFSVFVAVGDNVDYFAPPAQSFTRFIAGTPQPKKVLDTELPR